MANQARKIWLLLFTVFGSFIVSIVALKNIGRGDRFFGLFASIPYYDKIGHFVLMGLLSLFAVAALSPRLKLKPWPASLAVMVVVSVVVALEELSQSLFVSRTFSTLDLLFSIAGIIVFGFVGHLIAAATQSRVGNSMPGAR